MRLDQTEWSHNNSNKAVPYYDLHCSVSFATNLESFKACVNLIVEVILKYYHRFVINTVGILKPTIWYPDFEDQFLNGKNPRWP